MRARRFIDLAYPSTYRSSVSIVSRDDRAGCISMVMQDSRVRLRALMQLENRGNSRRHLGGTLRNRNRGSRYGARFPLGVRRLVARIRADVRDTFEVYRHRRHLLGPRRIPLARLLLRLTGLTGTSRGKGNVRASSCRAGGARFSSTSAPVALRLMPKDASGKSTRRWERRYLSPRGSYTVRRNASRHTVNSRAALRITRPPGIRRRCAFQISLIYLAAKRPSRRPRNVRSRRSRVAGRGSRESSRKTRRRSD